MPIQDFGTMTETEVPCVVRMSIKSSTQPFFSFLNSALYDTEKQIERESVIWRPQKGLDQW